MPNEQLLKTSTSNITDDAHGNKALSGVKIYRPDEELSITLGFHTPETPFGEVVSKFGIVFSGQIFKLVRKSGTVGVPTTMVIVLEKLQKPSEALKDISSIAKSFPAEIILLSYIQISAVVFAPELQLIVLFTQLQTPPVEAGGAIEIPLIRTSMFANVLIESILTNN